MCQESKWLTSQGAEHLQSLLCRVLGQLGAPRGLQGISLHGAQESPKSGIAPDWASLGVKELWKEMVG